MILARKADILAWKFREIDIFMNNRSKTCLSMVVGGIMKLPDPGPVAPDLNGTNPTRISIPLSWTSIEEIKYSIMYV